MMVLHYKFHVLLDYCFFTNEPIFSTIFKTSILSYSVYFRKRSPKKLTSTIYLSQVIGCLFLTAMFSSCVSTKSITYFQTSSDIDTARYATLATIKPTASRIQTDDILAVIVSSLSEESNGILNASNTSGVNMASFPGGTSSGSQPLGYLVDSTGAIILPFVGKVKVSGMTLVEASNFLKEKLSRYIKEPTVNVRTLNHKFTVIGEVSRPGVYNLIDNHTTLPEVIGMAGDLTVYGRRDNVMLIRTVNDRREVIKLDLTSRQVLNSPYYFIQANDVLYVESRPGRITSTDRSLQLLPIFFGMASTILVLVSLFRN